MTQILSKLAADFSTQLATAISIGGTTATLLSQTDDDGVSLPDGRYTFTLEGTSSNKEHITCTKTGISLSNIKSISRQGVETVGVVRSHRVGSSVVITDWAQLKFITNLLDGTTNLDAATPLTYDGVASITNSNSLATKSYVDNLVIAGVPDASTTVKGGVKMSVAPASPTNPIAVSDNDPRIPTQAENDALAGANGTPSSTNKYLTETFSALVNPVGLICPYAGSTAPNSNWAICDGAALSRTVYASLFGVVGTTYGAGDGSTTFNLPNLKTRVPAGKDTSDSAFLTLGQTGGAKTHTLTIAEMPSHTHSISYNNPAINTGAITIQTASNADFNSKANNVGLVSDLQGGSGAHNNLQPYLVVNYIIKIL